MFVKRKAVRVTLKELLVKAVDNAAGPAEMKRRQNQALEASHLASYLETPDDDAWQPMTRAWGDD